MAVPNPLKRVRSTINSLLEGIARITKLVSLSTFPKFSYTHSAIRRRYDRILYCIDPNNNSTPEAATVLWSSICFVAFLIFGGFAVGYPNHWMRIAVPVFNFVIFAAFATMSIKDVLSHRKSGELQ